MRDAIARLSTSSAFSIREGLAKQHIPRAHTLSEPETAESNFLFSMSKIDDPTENYSPWRYDRLVIQDPFLLTHVRFIISTGSADNSALSPRTTRKTLQRLKLLNSYKSSHELWTIFTLGVHWHWHSGHTPRLLARLQKRRYCRIPRCILRL
jgi:hypothetical protein